MQFFGRGQRLGQSKGLNLIDLDLLKRNRATTLGFSLRRCFVGPGHEIGGTLLIAERWAVHVKHGVFSAYMIRRQ
ncbi:hypothetical protein A9G05_09280 [Pseudomonas sp. ENNP23]|nr:hypothetical protein A9G05_09280 [Pseudomonas sp. ENNP23]